MMITSPREAFGENRAIRESALAVYADRIYGRPPAVGVKLGWELLAETPGPSGSTRRQMRIVFSGPNGQASLTVLAQIPRRVRGSTAEPFPAFMGLNFLGNHTTTEDSHVLAPAGTGGAEGVDLFYDEEEGVVDGPPKRGAKASGSPWALVASRGYAKITACYLELGPDAPQIFDYGLHPTLDETRSLTRTPSTWGAISLWAWALCSLLDALELGMMPEIDATKVIVHGHSRLGKAALWAAALDERFAAAISNNTGCMGAAASRAVGETVEMITTSFPHWFTPGFNARISGGRGPLIDQDQLLASIAPRPLYVASASEDHHADPEGEFLSWRRASAAWPPYASASSDAFPSPGGSVRLESKPLGYHLREGKHTVETFDWERWLDFADSWVVTSSED